MSETHAHQWGINQLFSTVIRWVNYLAFFLVPLFFLPFTSEVLEQNKQVLLVVLTVLGLVSWLGQMVLSKQGTVRSGGLNVVPGAFLLITLVSSIFSVSHYQSWIGQNGQEYISFLTVAVFVVLFYLLSNAVSGANIQKNILFAVLLSSVLVGIVATLGMFDLAHLPFAFATSTGFTTVGVFSDYVAYMVTVTFMGLAMWLVSQAEHQTRVIADGTMGLVTRVLVGLVTLMTLVALLAVDFWVFWLLAILGVVLLAAFGFLQSDEFPNPKRFAVPLVILLFSILFLFLPTPLHVKVPATVSPSFGASWHIVTSTLGSNMREFFFGSGPGTYVYDFLAFKPVGVNASQFWSTGFNQAKSFFLTEFVSVGLLGALAWLVLFGWLLVKTVGFLIKERSQDSWKMTYVLFVAWVLLLATHFLSSSNFTLQFMLWGLTGLLASHVITHGFETDFSRSPKLGLAASFVFVLVGVGVLGSLFVSGQYYLGDLAFTRAVSLNRQNADMQQVVNKLAEAIKYNGGNDAYYRNLSAALLAQAQAKINEAKGEQLSADQTKVVSNLVTAAVNAASRATVIEPNRVSNWVVLGSVYRNLMTFVQNSEDKAAQAFTNAIKLEPSNPEHRTDLGRVYLAVADRARTMKSQKNADVVKNATEQEQKSLTNAEQIFLSAIQLKGDYLPAHYYLAGVYERQGKTQDAMARLEALTKAAPSDIGLGFELSQMYIRTQNYPAAQAQLERIIGINPKYSNALWYLASVYELEKNPGKAVEAVQKVVDLNPDNKIAKDRLAKLKSGESTTTVPEPIQKEAAVEETTSSDSAQESSDTVAPSDASDSTDTSSTKKKNK